MRPWYVRPISTTQMTGFCGKCTAGEYFLRAFHYLLSTNCNCRSQTCPQFEHHNECEFFETGVEDGGCECECDCDDCEST